MASHSVTRAAESGWGAVGEVAGARVKVVMVETDMVWDRFPLIQEEEEEMWRGMTLRGCGESGGRGMWWRGDG